MPEGGYFLWVELPEEVDTEQLLAAAGERGVTFVKGSDFMLEGGRNALRLAFSAVTPEQIDEGVKRLARGARGRSRTAREAGARHARAGDRRIARDRSRDSRAVRRPRLHVGLVGA